MDEISRFQNPNIISNLQNSFQARYGIMCTLPSRIIAECYHNNYFSGENGETITRHTCQDMYETQTGNAWRD